MGSRWPYKRESKASAVERSNSRRNVPVVCRASLAQKSEAMAPESVGSLNETPEDVMEATREVLEAAGEMLEEKGEELEETGAVLGAPGQSSRRGEWFRD